MNFRYSDSSLVTEKDILKVGKNLLSFAEHLNKVAEADNYNFDESSINLAADEKLLEEVQRLRSQKITPEFKYFINIGIGGSNLGTKAIYDGLVGFFETKEPQRFPKMEFVDTTNPKALEKIIELLVTNCRSEKEFLISVISKSGTTTETIANAEVIVQGLQEKFPEIADRIVVITDMDSKLWQFAKDKKIDALSIPEKVGGRFSVFSSVGLFPLACCGFDINKLRAGALRIRQHCLQSEILENPAMLSAIVLFWQIQEGKAIHDTFLFNQEFESLGKWYRQLTGESLGKEKDLKGKVVNAGITPTVSLGSTDLHSVAQLYFGGPKDKITTFVYAKNVNDTRLPGEQLFFEGLVDGIKGKSVSHIIEAIYQGVKITYKSQELPFMEVTLEDISEDCLGEFLQFKMIEIMYLGRLLNVNTFDQPQVELYKTETRKILNQ